ncbi:hypothetical protein OIU85_003146 [Salix viminalis]|uniref:BZIP domain-containing protein n=1 Tax=Salix viminalis TaxID=40686 RepID=A0A9Q0T143_SALVM|nr:hypothetical protein OIU85_003146 [Salix viminalis]
MAQLPPKIPNVTPSWPDFSHKKLPKIGIMETSPPHDGNTITAAAATSTIVTNPSWVDEFLDFSLTRRGTHRRSVSDSIAFLEEAPTMIEKCRGAGAPGIGSGQNSSSDFDKFDDEQLMSMFNDDISDAVAAPNSSCTPSSPSDHSSFKDEKEAIAVVSKQRQKVRKENDEGKSPSEWETPSSATDPATTSNERKIDPKRVKRILANRQSAQRSRVRKLQYISELERSVTSLQAEVSVLSPRVAYLDHRRLLLNVDNSSLKQRIAALAQDKIFKDGKLKKLLISSES